MSSAPTLPGPGHQLGYCLTTNHPSCPQLRAYEAQRQAEAQAQPAQPQPVPPGPAQPPIAAAITPQPPTGATEWVSRAPWLVVGALSAVVVVLVLTLAYAAPGGRTATAEPAGSLLPTPLATSVVEDPAPVTLTPADVVIAPAVPAAEDDATSDGAAASVGDGAIGAATEPSDEAPLEPEVQLTAYVVEPGDTLLTISWKFGVSVDDLLAANDLTFDSPIYYGLPLVVPLPAE